MATKIEGHGIPFDPIEPADLNTPPLKAESEKNIIEDNAQPANLPQIKKTKSRIVVILLTILTLLFFSAAIAFFVAKENEINQRLKVQAELEQLQSDKASVDRELKSTLIVKEQLEIDLAQRKENYTLLLGQFQQQQSDNDALMEKFNEKMKLVDSLKGRLEKEEQDKKLLGSKFEAINIEYDDVKKQLSQIRMAKDALENRILQLSRKRRANTVELETIVVDSDNPADPVPAAGGDSAGKLLAVKLGPPARLEGQVLVVNKEFAFVVINIGEKDGIQESQILDVYRGQDLLGKVQVERIYDTMSSAVILPEATKQELKEGDIVKLM